MTILVARSSKLAAVFALLFVSSATLAQEKIHAFEVADTIVYATVDRPGDLYIITKNGQIQKFSKDGKLIVLYKHEIIPTLFEARDGAKYFAYYRENQEYDYLSPSFEILSAYKIDPAFAIEPYLICTSGEHKLWVLDNADHSLKKVNVQKGEVEIEVVIDSTVIQDAGQFTAMREYQGFVFLLNPKKGVYIFNSIGRHIKTVGEAGLSTFNFLGEELYYQKGNTIKFLDLFDADQREVVLDKSARTVLLTDERMFLVDLKTVTILKYTP